jgi:hypothetical protein
MNSMQQSRKKAERDKAPKFDLLAAIKEEDEAHPN